MSDLKNISELWSIFSEPIKGWSNLTKVKIMNTFITEQLENQMFQNKRMYWRCFIACELLLVRLVDLMHSKGTDL